jgi:hypothetical protein
MKKEDLYNAKSVEHGVGSTAELRNKAVDRWASDRVYAQRDKIGPNGIRIQTVGSFGLSPVPEWLNEYPLVIERDGKFYLRNSKEWVKLTHLTVKHKYHVAVFEVNESEANRLMEGMVWLNKYHAAMPAEPDKAKRKPIMWYVARLAIWWDIKYLGGIRPYHSGAMLALAEKYGVDYDGNVYQEGW